MRQVARIRHWCRNLLVQRQARRLKQPAYPYAGTVQLLRRLARRLAHPGLARAYCDGLPPNVFCRVNPRTVDWWVLTENILWMAQVDRESHDVAFAACTDFSGNTGQMQREMQNALAALYTTGAKAVSWEERLARQGALSDQWMQRNRRGHCLPGLLVAGGRTPAANPATERMRTALRLQNPQRLEVAVPLMLHGLWADMRKENIVHEGGLAEAWQLASALVDNPWESWQSVQSGRFAELNARV